MSKTLCKCLGLFAVGWLFVACAPVKTMDVWKDDGYSGRLNKVLIIAVTKEDSVREQFENILTNRLSDRGVIAIASHKVIPKSDKKPDKETVLTAVKETGANQVLVARSIGKKEISNHQPGGMFFAPNAVYSDGWYTYYTGTMIYPEREYDTSYFTVATNLFEINNPKPVWSYLAQVRVEGSKQAAVEDFLPLLIQQLKDSQLL
ncbi:MAG: hypothetical protein JRF07_01900 [Deltaproteobacteria bacterium]|nr:hypothetical protein [Deltaproteobacteria bacterium]